MTRSIARMILLAGCALSLSEAAVLLSFSPGTTNVSAGQSFSVDLLADLPDPIVGWGLDLSFNSAVLSLTGFTLDSQWTSVLSPDGDNIGGLAFPSAIGGNGVRLGTFSFMALANGTSPLETLFDSGDFTEGFLLASGSFDSVAAAVGSVQVGAPGPTPVPEPSTWHCLALACGALTLRRGRLKRWATTALTSGGLLAFALALLSLAPLMAQSLSGAWIGTAQAKDSQGTVRERQVKLELNQGTTLSGTLTDNSTLYTVTAATLREGKLSFRGVGPSGEKTDVKLTLLSDNSLTGTMQVYRDGGVIVSQVSLSKR